MFLGSGELCSLGLFLLWEAMETAKDRKGTWPVPLHTLGWVFDGNFVDYRGIVKNFLGVSGREGLV